MVMFELTAHQPPWAGLEQADIFQKVTAGERPPISAADYSGAPSGWFSLLQECWAQQPEARPSFDQICEQLQSMLDSTEVSLEAHC